VKILWTENNNKFERILWTLNVLRWMTYVIRLLVDVKVKLSLCLTMYAPRHETYGVWRDSSMHS